MTLLYAAAACIGLIALGGWFMDVAQLKSVNSEWVTMKTGTAISFEIAAWCGMATRYCRHRLVAVLGGSCLLVLSGLSTGAYLSGGDGLDIWGNDTTAYTVAPGIPSLGTLLCFVLFGYLLIARSYEISPPRILTFFIVAAGVLAHLGYFLNVPALYYYWPGISTAMAFHTALAFECLGLAWALQRKEEP